MARPSHWNSPESQAVRNGDYFFQISHVHQITFPIWGKMASVSRDHLRAMKQHFMPRVCPPLHCDSYGRPWQPPLGERGSRSLGSRETGRTEILPASLVTPASCLLAPPPLWCHTPMVILGFSALVATGMVAFDCNVTHRFCPRFGYGRPRKGEEIKTPW